MIFATKSTSIASATVTLVTVVSLTYVRGLNQNPRLKIYLDTDGTTSSLYVDKNLSSFSSIEGDGYVYQRQILQWDKDTVLLSHSDDERPDAVYNCTSHEWSLDQNLVGFQSSIAITKEGALLVVGGVLADNTVVTDVKIYDNATSPGRLLTHMKEPRATFTMGVLEWKQDGNDKHHQGDQVLLVAGGRGVGRKLGVGCELINLKSQNATECADLPFLASSSSSLVWNKKVMTVLVGGKTKEGIDMNGIYGYDVKTNTWKSYMDEGREGALLPSTIDRYSRLYVSSRGKLCLEGNPHTPGQQTWCRLNMVWSATELDNDWSYFPGTMHKKDMEHCFNY